jgi:hypothetical protein
MTPADLNNVDPPPWQSPFVDIRLKDGSLVQGVVSEAWLWYFLQLRSVVPDGQGTDTLAVALSGLPNRVARSDSELGAVLGLMQLLQGATSRILRLESELGSALALLLSVATRRQPAVLPANSIFTASWTAQTNFVAIHNLGTTAVLVQVYDANGILRNIPSIVITNSNEVTLGFGAAFTGSVVIFG